MLTNDVSAAESTPVFRRLLTNMAAVTTTRY